MSESEQSSSDVAKSETKSPGLRDGIRVEILREVSQAVVRSASFSSPVPPPEDLGLYNEMVPNDAERVFAIVERQQEIRAVGQAGSLANDRIRIRGAIIVGCGIVIVAGIAAWNGYTVAAISLGLGGFLSALLKQCLDILSKSRRG